MLLFAVRDRGEGFFRLYRSNRGGNGYRTLLWYSIQHWNSSDIACVMDSFGWWWCACRVQHEISFGKSIISQATHEDRYVFMRFRNIFSLDLRWQNANISHAINAYKREDRKSTSKLSTKLLGHTIAWYVKLNQERPYVAQDDTGRQNICCRGLPLLGEDSLDEIFWIRPSSMTVNNRRHRSIWS